MKIIRECHLLDSMKWIIFNYVALRILNLFKIRNRFKIRNTSFELYRMGMCLNLQSLDREILQIKI